MKTVLVAFGTRPEAIKMAPVVAALRARPQQFRTRVLVTGQHRDLLDQVLARFDLEPDIDLDLMQPGQTLTGLTARVLTAMATTLQDEAADIVLVQGDTTTAMATGMAAFYARIPVGHIEAGLRSGRMDAPFPEEMNRVVLDAFCDWVWPPTPQAAQNLDGDTPARSLVTGNTSIDALLALRTRLDDIPLPVKDLVEEGQRVVLVTAHRRESFGMPLLEVFSALQQLAAENQDVTFIYPVHPNPNVSVPARQHLVAPNFKLIEPIDYAELVWLLDRAAFVISDSGGLQEEAPTLGKPILILRDVTERPEVVASGAGQLVGTDKQRIVEAARRLLTDSAHLATMGQPRFLFGDGLAAERIAAHIAGESPTPWAPGMEPPEALHPASRDVSGPSR